MTLLQKGGLGCLGGLAFLGGLFIVSTSLFQGKWFGTETRHLVFSPDSTTLYGGGIEFSPEAHHGWLWAWETATGRLRWQAKVEGPVRRLALSPDGTTLLTAGVQSVYTSEGGKTWGAATLWDAQTGQVRCILSTSEGQAQTDNVFFTPDGRQVLGCFQKGIQVWETTTGKALTFWPIPKNKTGWPESLHFTADGSRFLLVATGWSSGEPNIPGGEAFVQLWDAHSGKVLHDFPGSERYDALSADGQWVALAKSRLQQLPNDNSTSVWRIVVKRAETESERTESPELPVEFDLYALSFTPEGMVLLEGEYDKIGAAIRPWNFVWNPATGSLKEAPLSPRLVSHDGTLAAETNGGGYRSRPPLGTLFDARTQKKLRDLDGKAGR